MSASNHPEEIEEGEIITDDEMTEEEEEMSVNDEEDEFDEEDTDIIGLMTSLMATPDGDTVCSALVDISTQMQVQNKILIKILAKLKN
jgi:hypothetical protein|tara:strand:- start:1440 stop:1703 length:264 start_codon:yes stop_codon:yes gene_type:complete